MAERKLSKKKTYSKKKRKMWFYSLIFRTRQLTGFSIYSCNLKVFPLFRLRLVTQNQCVHAVFRFNTHTILACIHREHVILRACHWHISVLSSDLKMPFVYTLIDIVIVSGTVCKPYPFLVSKHQVKINKYVRRTAKHNSNHTIDRKEEKKIVSHMKPTACFLL